MRKAILDGLLHPVFTTGLMGAEALPLPHTYAASQFYLFLCSDLYWTLKYMAGGVSAERESWCEVIHPKYLLTHAHLPVAENQSDYVGCALNSHLPWTAPWYTCESCQIIDAAFQDDAH